MLNHQTGRIGRADPNARGVVRPDAAETGQKGNIDPIEPCSEPSDASNSTLLNKASEYWLGEQERRRLALLPDSGEVDDANKGFGVSRKEGSEGIYEGRVCVMIEGMNGR